MLLAGTILNIMGVIAGSLIGMFLGSRLPEKMRSTITAGLGLFTAAIGMQMFLETNQPLIVLGSVLLGAIIGEWWQIDNRLNNIGSWLEMKFMSRHEPVKLGEIADENLNHSASRLRFIRGFVTATLVYCIGPIAILGSIQDGLNHDYNLLAIKSALDFFASIAFASSLGIGVMFSAVIILVYQGSLTLLAAQVQAWVTDPMIAEMSAVGGLLLVGIAISSLLEIKPIRIANFLPAIFIAPVLVAVIAYYGA